MAQRAGGPVGALPNRPAGVNGWIPVVDLVGCERNDFGAGRPAGQKRKR